MSARLLDIARRAKVSLPVVSIVVNRSRGTAAVSPATRKRILKIAREMNYVPHAAAQATRQGRFHRIAAAIVQYGPPGTSYTPHNGYTDAAVNELAERGYSLVLEPLHLDHQTDRFFEPPRLFSELAVDGILGLPASGVVPVSVDDQLKDLKAPVIWMNRGPEETTNNVLCDEAAGTKLLVRHLLDLGHRRIGYLGFQTPHYSAAQRFETIRSELQAERLDTSGLVIADHAGLLLETTEELFSRSSPPTALICLNCLAYQTAVHVMAQRGLRVPRDVSICYFASPWEMALTRFPVTVLEVPEAPMAITAARMLIDLIDGKRITKSPKLVGTLHVGKTTGRTS